MSTCSNCGVEISSTTIDMCIDCLDTLVPSQEEIDKFMEVPEGEDYDNPYDY